VRVSRIASPGTEPIDLDQTVELLGPNPDGSLVVAREKMSLRAAVERILAAPVEDAIRYGIGLHAPLFADVDARPALRGYMSGEAVRYRWGEPAWPMERGAKH